MATTLRSTPFDYDKVTSNVRERQHNRSTTLPGESATESYDLPQQYIELDGEESATLLSCQEKTDDKIHCHEELLLNHKDRYQVLIIATIVASIWCYILIVSPVAGILIRTADFNLAKQQSYGFFTDISSLDWEQMRNREYSIQPHHPVFGPDKFYADSPAFHANNWDVNFACQHERRIGVMGDGGKWICDPHRVEMKNGQKCLIYSVGSAGRFDFEIAVKEMYGEGTCEIHIFDPDDFSETAPEGTFYHKWGMEGSHPDPRTDNWGPVNSKNSDFEFKSIQETIDILGHHGRTIEIFKIDCDYCEYRTYTDFIEADVFMRQILIEVHGSPGGIINEFFQAFHDDGYVIFHKEPNTQYGGGTCVEYSLLKLNKEFFLTDKEVSKGDD